MRGECLSCVHSEAIWVPFEADLLKFCATPRRCRVSVERHMEDRILRVTRVRIGELATVLRNRER
jgi:hypothetical protein